jgi:NTE family protein
MLIPPRRILLSGGGIRAVSHLGALQHLETKGLLKAVKEYVGVSAGAFIGFCLAIGYTISELRILCILFDFSLVRNLDPEAALLFPTTFGLDDGQNLSKLLVTLLKAKNLSPSLTFKDLTIFELRCYATDLHTTQMREFSVSKTPNVKLVDALRASMSLPAYFTPVCDPETGNTLIDGGILHNFPMDFLTESEIKETLGISFLYSTRSKINTIEDLPTFFSQIFACYFIPRTQRLYVKYKERCILIPIGEYPSWNFEATREDRETILEAGKKAAEVFLDRFKVRRPLRRYSVS